VLIFYICVFDASAFDALYFGVNQIDNGVVGAGLNGTANAFSFVGITGSTATWEADTTWINDVTGDLQNAKTRLEMTIAGLTWITDLASIGLDTFGDLGAVVDNSSGADFTLEWNIMADTGGGWLAINSIQQADGNDGNTKSNFATGFYYTTPAPAVLVLLSMGLVGVGAATKIRNKNH
jgi:hypothetical protein